MKQEDKELLLLDLCARLPYGVVIQEKCLEYDETFLPYAEDNKVVNIDVHEDLVITGGGSRYYIEDIKPYLFPLSSMTYEQIHEFNQILGKDCDVSDGYINIIDSCRKTFSYQELDALLQFLNKNHLDYRGLIPMGLAIDATNLNIY